MVEQGGGVAEGNKRGGGGRAIMVVVNEEGGVNHKLQLVSSFSKQLLLKSLYYKIIHTHCFFYLL